MKKIIAFTLAIISLLSVFSLSSCKEEYEFGTNLSFAKANSIEEMKKLDGKTVSIVGYMSTLSPISGAFMYLLNLPYQSCPFCEPNSTTLSNTIAVYAPNGKKFKFTDRLIKVTGTLEFGDYEDEYGFNYSYRIKDATFVEVDTSEMSGELKLWQELASTDVVGKIYEMYDYINFLCFWGTYTYNWDEGKDYLYPADIDMFLVKDGAQFNYGYKDGYFDGLIATIESVDKTAFKDLVKNIRDAEKLAAEALQAYRNGEYAAVPEYSNSFGDGRTQYKMKDADEYEERLSKLYKDFASWIGEWEV